MTTRSSAAKKPAAGRSNGKAPATGFVRPRKVYVLTFDDPSLAGLEVRARSVPVGMFLSLVALASTIDESDGFTPDVAAAFDGLVDGFAGALESWNLQDEDGTPVPTTAEAVKDQDSDFVMQLVSAWMEAVGEVDAPLGPGSSGGDRTLEASLPMDPPL